MDVRGESVADCELSVLLSAIQINPNGTLESKSIDFLNKLAYFDLSDGIDRELCILIISKWCGQNDRDKVSSQEKEADDVLQMLRDNNIVSEMKKASHSNEIFFQMQPDLQEKILAQNASNLSFLIDLVNILKNIWLDMSGAFIFKSHIFHIHKSLKRLGWPGDTIKLSICLASSLLYFDFEETILDDIKEFFNASDKKSYKIDWITFQMINIHKDTISKSRKVLQPSDIICIVADDGPQEIRLDNYGSWMLNQIRIYSDSDADCDALISVAVISLDRLQKHARFCNRPNELTLDWIIAYRGRDWYNFNSFAALACFDTSDEWLSKLCRAYIQNLGEKVECCENSEFSLNDSYRSWVCLRDLVKTSRIQHSFIAALCEEDGLQFLNRNFLKCETTLASQEYCLKYQAQTVIEMLEPLINIGKSELVAKLLKMETFWNFTIVVLQKHPFINERVKIYNLYTHLTSPPDFSGVVKLGEYRVYYYNLSLENDLLCACEVYLDLLVASCNRKDDGTVDDGFLCSFFMTDYVHTYTAVVREAREIVEIRRRHTCIYYLFTILFTLSALLKSDELVDVYVTSEVIREVINEYSDDGEGTTFEVADGCLREYGKYIEVFCDRNSHESKFADVIRLARKMLKVPVKYEWESDKE